MANFKTRNWIVGILIGAWIASLIVGSLHGADIISEPANPIIHTFQDWLFVIIPLVPISYLLARVLPNK